MVLRAHVRVCVRNETKETDYIDRKKQKRERKRHTVYGFSPVLSSQIFRYAEDTNETKTNTDKSVKIRAKATYLVKILAGVIVPDFQVPRRRINVRMSAIAAVCVRAHMCA
jgi:hypothetical protein